MRARTRLVQRAGYASHPQLAPEARGEGLDAAALAVLLALALRLRLSSPPLSLRLRLARRLFSSRLYAHVMIRGVSEHAQGHGMQEATRQQ